MPHDSRRTPVGGGRTIRTVTARTAPILLVLALCSIGAAGAETFGTITDIEVVRVYDGDTFFADIAGYPPLIGDDIGIRVRGVDCPEIRGSCDRERQLAREARDFVEELLGSADQISLVDLERGKYFRIVATVLVDGQDLSALLISEGLAVPYEERDEANWCR